VSVFNSRNNFLCCEGLHTHIAAQCLHKRTHNVRWYHIKRIC